MAVLHVKKLSIIGLAPKVRAQNTVPRGHGVAGHRALSRVVVACEIAIERLCTTKRWPPCILAECALSSASFSAVTSTLARLTVLFSLQMSIVGMAAV
jgi:hypothetical protein